MTTIVPPPISAAVALGPISQLLPPQYRFVGDDWDDETQFLFTFYTVLPTFGPSTTDPNTGATIPGPVLTPGQVRDLTNCTFSGTVSYRPRPAYRWPSNNPPSCMGVTPPQPTAPQAMVGTVNVGTGQAALTLASNLTVYPRQDPGLWTPDVPGFEDAALLVVQARLTDSYGKTSTQGVIPLFVF